MLTIILTIPREPPTELKVFISIYSIVRFISSSSLVSLIGKADL
jgi:hypothetical protein